MVADTAHRAATTPVARGRGARRWVYGLSAALGAGGAGILALASDLPASPYGPKAAGLWPLAATGSAPGWEGPKVPAWAMVADQGPGVGPGHLLTTLAVVAGVALLALAWLILWRTTRINDLRLSLRNLWWIVGAWVAPLLLAAPLASQDVWHYGAEGKLVTDGFGGYRPASLLGHSVWTLGVDAKWAARPSLYGPGAMDLSAFFVRISGGRPWVAAECWRLSSIIGLLLCSWGAQRIVSLRGGNPTTALLAAVANPAVVIILVGGIHNDALMLGLTVAGVALALSDHRLGGLVVCALGVAVKPNALLALGALAWWAWGTPWRSRIKGAVAAAVTLVAVLAVSGLGVGGGFGWFSSVLSYAWVPGPWSLGPQFFGARSGFPVTFIEMAGTAMAVVLVLTVRRSGGFVVALGWGFAALAVTTPTPEPWYLAWALVLLACGGLERRSERVGVVALATMMAGGVLPLGVLLWFEGVVTLGALGVLSVRTRLRTTAPSTSPAHDEKPDPAGDGDDQVASDPAPPAPRVPAGLHRR